MLLQALTYLPSLKQTCDLRILETFAALADINRAFNRLALNSVAYDKSSSTHSSATCSPPSAAT